MVVNGYTNAAAVTPSDSTVVNARGLYIGGAGAVSVDMLGTPPGAATGAVVFAAVPVGTVLPIAVARVRSTGTTATNIVALF